MEKKANSLKTMKEDGWLKPGCQHISLFQLIILEIHIYGIFCDKHMHIVFNNQIHVVNITNSLNIWKKCKSDKHVFVYSYEIQYSLK